MLVLAQLDAPRLTKLTISGNPLKDRGFIEGFVRSGLIKRLR